MEGLTRLIASPAASHTPTLPSTTPTGKKNHFHSNVSIVYPVEPVEILFCNFQDIYFFLLKKTPPIIKHVTRVSEEISNCAQICQALISIISQILANLFHYTNTFLFIVMFSCLMFCFCFFLSFLKEGPGPLDAN